MQLPESLIANREKVDSHLLHRLDEAQGNPRSASGKVLVIIQLACPYCREELGTWQATLKGLGGRYRQPLPLINGFSASLPLGALAQLLANPEIARVSSDQEMGHCRT